MTCIGDETPYTREEVAALGDRLPERGPRCPHCDRRIPQFADLTEVDERRVRQLIRHGYGLMAAAELQAATGCSRPWADAWVEHCGRLIPGPPVPCPYCGQPLKTSFAKQCPHCKRDWHDPNNVRFLGEARELGQELEQQLSPP